MKMNKEITISNIDELIDYLELNYDSLSEKDYGRILFETLDVYASKLESKEEAIKQILDYHKLISSRPKQWEKPFFMDQLL